MRESPRVTTRSGVEEVDEGEGLASRMGAANVGAAAG
ncbi:hypothetical protein QE454_002468 [Microbacterium sp. SORGH_AS454]|nr:hypothetical protein [Microbacterium sp. SORGH_AS_0454]